MTELCPQPQVSAHSWIPFSNSSTTCLSDLYSVSNHFRKRLMNSVHFLASTDGTTNFRSCGVSAKALTALPGNITFSTRSSNPVVLVNLLINLSLNSPFSTSIRYSVESEPGSAETLTLPKFCSSITTVLCVAGIRTSLIKARALSAVTSILINLSLISPSR